MNWQPIETAPKNKWIIVCDVDAIDPQSGPAINRGKEWLGIRTTVWLKPTHWMPFPETPKVEA